MLVKYVGPFDEVRFYVNGDEKTCKQNETVDVPADVAGSAPKGEDLGTGLLAQPDNWQAANAKASKEEK